MGLTMAEACPKDANWFALAVKPQHEKVVAEQLQVKGVETYLPLYRARRRWSDRVKTLELPLFPRYVFSRFRFDDRHSVMATPGFRTIVGFGGKPCAVREDEIEAVKTMVGSGLPVMPWPLLRVGQRVRICAGAMAGIEGILLREKSLCRIVVNVHLLNRGVAVEVERDLVKAIAGAPQAPLSELYLV